MTSVLGYVNHGRWVADCPACNGGIRIIDEGPVTCRDCGAEYDVDLPGAGDRERAEAVLKQRALPHRNWHPDKESVADLKAENATKGVPFT